MSGARPGRQAPAHAALWLGLGAVLLGLALAGCGKKGSLEPPKGEESKYTYPHTYPNPASVVPGAPPAGPAATQAAPPGGDLSAFPKPRKRTTYGPTAQ